MILPTICDMPLEFGLLYGHIHQLKSILTAVRMVLIETNQKTPILNLRLTCRTKLNVY